MADTKIDSAVASNLQNVMKDFEVGTMATDGVFEQKETTWNHRCYGFMDCRKRIQS